MAGPNGIEAVATLARHAKSRRGGKGAVREAFERQAPDALVVWRDASLESLGAVGRGLADAPRSDVQCRPPSPTVGPCH